MPGNAGRRQRPSEPPSRQTELFKWFYGDIGNEQAIIQKNIHKITYQAQILPQKQLIILVFGSLIAYVLLVICGTMGSPNPVKINKVECGIHNDCTLSSKAEFNIQQFLGWRSIRDKLTGSTLNLAPVGHVMNQTSSSDDLQNQTSSTLNYLNNHIQICEVNNLQEKKLFNIDSELGLKFYVDQQALKSSGGHKNELDLKLSYGIYESNNILFYHHCLRSKYQPAEAIIERNSFNGLQVAIETLEFRETQLQSLECQQNNMDEGVFLKKLESTPTIDDPTKVKRKISFEQFQT
mmetsp:Transcript_15753/g.26580  ORF Transcript_15753/g.26580 Transcript_15753/m.26580 type:complete len:293 (+) Transcript_15753:8-886(+)